VPYICTGKGCLHLATVIDIASRPIAGHAMPDYLWASATGARCGHLDASAKRSSPARTAVCRGQGTGRRLGSAGVPALSNYP
jgi:transposase InsO family protein